MRKKIFLALIVILYCWSAQAQLQEVEPYTAQWTTVGDVKWLANTKASLKYFANGSDTTYLLYMQDEQKLKNNRDITVHQHFSISFNGTNNTAGKLYDLLLSFFTKENRKDKSYEKTFRLGKVMVLVRHFPKLTGAAISLSTTQNSIVFTEKEIKKLFNKN